MYAENLKKIRLELGLSVAKFAEKLEMSANTLTNYEQSRREPSYNLFVQLNKKLNVNLNWFVSGHGNMFNAPQFEQVKDNLAIEVRKILKEEGLIK
jgi:transcriptional regulator with XRE-family HTH domain